MAAAYTGGPGTTPIYNAQQAAQLQSGDFSSLNPPAGAGGGIYPLGQGVQYTRVYATVQSGEPIIVNPETGEPYPPGFIPTIQDPNTRENWQPGDSWTEIRQQTNAQSSEVMRLARERLIRPGEENAANLIANWQGKFDQAVTKYSTGLSEAMYGKDNKTLQDINAREQRYKQIAQQQLQAAQQQPYQPQAALQLPSSAPYATPQQLRVGGGAFQGGQQSLPPASGGTGRKFTLVR